MALTISYDGYGVVANADGLTDSAGGSWNELGGGTISSNPDVYLYGSSSIGNQYASKSGYSYFAKTSSLNFTTTEAGQYVYMWLNISAAGTFDLKSAPGFTITIGSSTANSYEYTIAGGEDANGWTGGWKLFVVDILNTTPTKTNGTPDLTAINTFGVWVDTAVSVRADSVFLSQIMCARGLKVTGTPTVYGGGYDEIVTWCTDYTNRAAGMFQKRGSTYYSLGQLTIGDTTQAAITAFSSSGDSIEYEATEYWNGTAWASTLNTAAHKLLFENNTTYGTTFVSQDTSLTGLNTTSSVGLLVIDSSGGTSLGYNGGQLKSIGTWILKSSDSLNNVIISSSNGLKPNGSIIQGCTINSTLATTGSGALHIETLTDISNTVNVTFNKYISKYAVYIPSTVTGTVSFDGWEFDGSGTDVYWEGTSGTLTVALTNGANASTYASAGGVVAFENSVALTVTGLRENVEIRIYKITDMSLLSGAEDHTEMTFDYAEGGINYYKYVYSYNAGVLNGTDVYLHIIGDAFVFQRIEYTLGGTNAGIPIQLQTDRNYSNP